MAAICTTCNLEAVDALSGTCANCLDQRPRSDAVATFEAPASDNGSVTLLVERENVVDEPRRCDKCQHPMRRQGGGFVCDACGTEDHS